MLAGLGLSAVLLATGCASPAPTTTARQLSAATRNPALDPGTPLDQPAPTFTLTDQFGHRVSLGQFRGRAVLLAFVDARCTTICPLTTTSMTRALQMLGPAAGQVALLGVDANPNATRVADVLAYSRAHGMTHLWHFLTGSRPALGQVWKDYRVYVQASHGQIDHEPAIYLISPAGREARVFLTQMAYTAVDQQAEMLANAISAVLPDHPKPGHLVSLAYHPGIPPARVVDLPVVAGAGSRGTLRLGPGAPHLVVFFASWDNENSNVPAQLLALNSYQRLARRHGWPTVVAVDDGPTEPGPAALRTVLAGVRSKLDYPVVVDRTGALADGYGVADEPWIVLVSGTGRLLLRNDGWFPPALLVRAVRRALH